MKYLFENTICDWSSWAKVYQDISVWQILIQHILDKEKLPCVKAENLTPGTNAVFKTGSSVIKIFAPKEAGVDSLSDYNTELFGLKRAETLEIPSPKLLACGCVHDKYDFMYLVMEYVQAESLGIIEYRLTDNEKKEIGRKLRLITCRLNTPCENFNRVDVITSALDNERWNIFSSGFKFERQAFLNKFDGIPSVYVHGDLNPDNVFVDDRNALHIIDFADALLAPAEYELAAIVFELFCFEKPYMQGFFGEDFNPEEVTESCFRGLLLHDFGPGMIRYNLGDTDKITALSILKERIHNAVISGGQL